MMKKKIEQYCEGISPREGGASFEEIMEHDERAAENRMHAQDMNAERRIGVAQEKESALFEAIQKRDLKGLAKALPEPKIAEHYPLKRDDYKENTWKGKPL